MVEVKNDLLLSVLERDTDLNRLKKKKKKQFDCCFSMIKANNTNLTQLQYFTHMHILSERREK